MVKKSQGYKGKVDLSVCSYCGDKVDNFSRTTDHLVPESRGGIKSNDNRVPSCSQCNRMKGDMNVEEFKRYMERVIELEYTWIKIKTGYFKRVAMNCRRIISESNPRDIVIQQKNNPDAKDNR